MNKKALDELISVWLRTTQRHVRQIGDRTSIFLNCRFNASLDMVWRALTDPELLIQWFAKVNGELIIGATRSFDVGAPFNITSQTLEIEPSQKLRFTWELPEREVDEVVILLSNEGDQALLELEQYSNDISDWWFGAGAGWESALVRLNLLLLGDDPKSITDDKFDELLGPVWIAAGNSKIQS